MNHAVVLPDRGLFDAWRDAARIAISHRIPPEHMEWHCESDHTAAGNGLFAARPLPDATGPHQLRVPQAFLKLAGSVIWHSAPERLGLLYHALWRIDRQDGEPLSQTDPLGRRLNLMAKSVGRDIHKMHAFVRFRELPAQNRRRFAAWFEPEHNTLEPGSRFFAKRFADMDWMIVTPRLTARFEGGMLSFHPGGARPELPEDAAENLWATYFTNIFNPARVKLAAMRAEMPKKYWKNLPETRLIPEMLKDAEARVERMRQAAAGAAQTGPRPGAAIVSARYRASMPVAPKMPKSLTEARLAALQCRRCRLCEAATQTVWGEGDAAARMMIVGEQPGDREDLAGRAFIGPAGLLLREILAETNIDPARLWLTNAVKHFKFTPRGKQRLHQSPNHAEIQACRWWLQMELAFIQPEIVVALGASAAFALTGNDSPLASRRGEIETGFDGGPVLISWHPSYILRLPDRPAQIRARQELMQDLIAAQARIEGLPQVVSNQATLPAPITASQD